MNRIKQAYRRGYQARVNNKPIVDNYYASLGPQVKILAGHWEAGWIKADKNMRIINE